MGDIRFADMMTNTQGIYKVKKVRASTKIREKVIDFFEDILEKNRNKFCEAEVGKSIIDSLISAQNLYYMDYEAMRKIEDNEEMRQKLGGKKYTR